MSTPLDHAEYINLESFKRDGTGVKTPVWTAPLDGGLVVFSESKAYKVKRIRRDEKVRIARCDVRGKLLGDWIDGKAHIMEDAAQIERGYDSLKRKYGLKMRTLNFFSRLAGKIDKRAMIFIEVP